MRRPRALAPGDRIALVAPASPFAREEFDAGLAELQSLGFEPAYDESVFARRGYVAGDAAVRAEALTRAWRDPSIAAIVAVRGGYGSVHVLPRLDRAIFAESPKVFLGYSDNTSLLSWLTLRCGIVTFHGPMVERRLSRGAAGYDRDTFHRCLCRAEPVGEITHPALEVLHTGEASGMLIGGTLTQIAASLGTPFAFEPPEGSVIFLEDIGERPYRIDRLFTQLKFAGVFARAAAIVFGEFTRCEESSGELTIRDVLAELVEGFSGPVLFGLPSGHTDGPTLTLPFGVRARVVGRGAPSLVIEEAAVV